MQRRVAPWLLNMRWLGLSIRKYAIGLEVDKGTAGASRPLTYGQERDGYHRLTAHTQPLDFPHPKTRAARGALWLSSTGPTPPAPGSGRPTGSGPGSRGS